VLRASLLAALPGRPAPSDGEDNNKLPNITADTAADINNSYINNSNADSNADNNNNNKNSYGNAEKDTIEPITGIRLHPVKKTIAVVVGNAHTCKRCHIPSPDPNNESNTPAPTTQAKHPRAARSRHLAGKVS
jgi:hypothetical protein